MYIYIYISSIFPWYSQEIPVYSNENPLEIPDLLCSKELAASICSSSAAASRTWPSSSVGSSARSVAQRCCSWGAGMAAAVLEARMPGLGSEGLEGLKWWDYVGFKRMWFRIKFRNDHLENYSNYDLIWCGDRKKYTWNWWNQLPN